jgi:hypothetical protein
VQSLQVSAKAEPNPMIVTQVTLGFAHPSWPCLAYGLEVARLVGHTSTRTTEVVYRRELRPVITTGAEVMDKIFSS